MGPLDLGTFPRQNPIVPMSGPMPRIASVLLPMPLPEAFDYAEPEGLGLAVGDHVTVPLGPRVIRGVVTALRDGTGGNRPLKPCSEAGRRPAAAAGRPDLRGMGGALFGRHPRLAPGHGLARP